MVRTSLFAFAVLVSGCGLVARLGDEPQARPSSEDTGADTTTTSVDTGEEVDAVAETDAVPEADAAPEADVAPDVDAHDAETSPPVPSTAPFFLYSTEKGWGGFVTADTDTGTITVLDAYDTTKKTPPFGGDYDHIAGDADLLVFHSPTMTTRKFGRLMGGKWSFIGSASGRVVDLAASLGPGRIVSYVSESGCLTVESTSASGLFELKTGCPGLRAATHLVTTPDGDMVLYDRVKGAAWRGRYEAKTNTIAGSSVTKLAPGWSMLTITNGAVLAVGTPSDPRKMNAFPLAVGDLGPATPVGGTGLGRSYQSVTALANGLLVFYLGEGWTGGSIEVGKLTGGPSAPVYELVRNDTDHIYGGFWDHVTAL